jgi:predicted MFS family arabinose efflux permease
MTTNKWVKFGCIYMGSAIISLSQLKIVPITVSVAVGNRLGVGEQQLQMLSAIFALAGVFLAIPGGAIVHTVGIKRTAVSLMLILALGNFLGATLLHFYPSYPLLLLTRAIEGMAFAIYLLVGMIYIGVWFADSGSGLAMGVFAAASALSQVIIFNLAPPLLLIIGYVGIWLLIGSLALLMAGILQVVIEPIIMPIKRQAKQNFLLQAMQHHSIWLLLIVHSVMTFYLFAMIQMGQLMMRDLHLLPEELAGRYASSFGAAGLVNGILAGLLIEKINKPVISGLLGFLLLILFLLLSDSLLQLIRNNQISRHIYIGWWTMLSFGFSLLFTSTLLLGGKLSDVPQVSSYHLAMLNTMHYLFILLGAPIFVQVVLGHSWAIALQLLLLISLFGGACLITFGYLHRHKGKMTTASTL